MPPTFEVAGPFSDAEIEDVRLPNAPLVKVLCQIRFPGTLGKLAGDSLDSLLADAFSDAGYPLLDRGQQVNLELTPEGLKSRAGDRVLNLRSVDDRWRVSLTANFITLETSAYTDRDDFVSRLSSVVDTLLQVHKVPGAGRVGYRYVNRVEGISATEGLELLREQFHAGSAVPEGEATLLTSLSEVMFSLDDLSSGQVIRNGLLARWGMLQPNQVVDPSVEPTSQPSWNLDIDAFRQSDIEFERDAISAEVRAMSERAYRFFRYAVTEKFMTRFGGA